MFIFNYMSQRFVIDSISDAGNLIGASSLYNYLFKKKSYCLNDFFEFKKVNEGVRVSFKKSPLPRKILAYEILISILMTYANSIKIGGMVIQTRVCRKARQIFQKPIHEEKFMFPKLIDISSIHPEKYVVVDLPYKEAAKLLLAQEYYEPLVHHDYCTVKVEPKCIESFILV